MNFQILKLVFEKAEKPEKKNANICWIVKKAREFQKKKKHTHTHIYFGFIDYSKPLTVWLTTSYGKFLNRWEGPTT